MGNGVRIKDGNRISRSQSDFHVRLRSHIILSSKVYRNWTPSPVFYHNMPYSPSPPKRLEESGAQAAPSGVNGCNPIWLLDDDVSMLRALGRLLASAGFSVEKFNDPAAFLSRLHQARCQVAILDVWMPVMNGLEVQALLNENSPETQIIFISGRDDPSVRQTALDAGAFAFLAKPFEDDVLVNTIHEARQSR
jgi:CheY-like chemotaxis protein